MSRTLGRQFCQVIVVCFSLLAGVAHSTNAADSIRSFVESNCLDCHQGSDAEASFDLSSLKFELNDPVVRRQWIKVFDRVEAGEMPPAEYGEVERDEKSKFLAHLKLPLVKAVRMENQTDGRSVVRRLNRVEYETALSDLLGQPFRIQERLPKDARQDGFDTVGAALNVSSVQMEAYLEVLDDVLDEATTLYPQPKQQQWKLDYRDTHGITEEYRRTGPFHILPDGVAFFAPEKHAHLNAVLDHFTIPYSAKYRVKVTAYAIRSDEPITLTIRTGGPGHSESDEVPKTLLGHKTVHTGDPQVFEFEQRLERGQFFRIYPSSLPYMRFVPNLKVRQKDYQGPGVVVQSVEVDGPIIDQWPPKSHQQLWEGVPTEPLPDVELNKDPNEHLLKPPSDIAKPRLTLLPKDKRNKESGNQWVYDPKQGVGGERIYRRNRIPDPLHPTMRFAPKHPKSEATRLITRFLPIAYRRPVSDTEVQLFENLVHRWLDEGDDFETAMRAGYKAILSSPGFLYHQGSLPTASQESNELNEHALAERLSFFLWSSMPDRQLRELADDGKLSDPKVLRSEVERMLDDPKSNRFVNDFLDQWLDLRQLDFTSPDSDLYPEHNPVLQWSLGEETRRFFSELLSSDLSVLNVIDSDFAILNSRLAEHYAIDGVDDMEFRKVDLSEDSVRGGVLTQASILKVTANGTTTSPVVRGVWVLERIVGTPANPPPPGIPAIEPDIRGATTVRQQLEQHRSSASCATCHKKIDPPGVALENFDVIGGWRDRYRAIDPEKADIKVAYLPNKSVPIKYKTGLPVDSSDTLPDGRRFEDVREFKQILLTNPDQVTRNLIEKLVTYATGAPISFADRVEVEQIIESTRPTDHGLRSVVHAIVQSEMFRTK
ncbi:DUF1592 domain-containing protein [Bremerella sp. TYQ1]|nr:DUF1592 domain-containing protein [Bremerella volcania]